MKNNTLKLIILAIISFLFLSYKFNEIPKNIANDEAELAKVALSLDKEPFVPFSTLADGHPTLYFYLMLGSFKIFGINNFALRVPSFIFSLLSVLIFYLIMKIVFKDKARRIDLPFILALVFLTLRWFFNFARFSFEMPFLLFLELTSIYFLLNYLEIKKTKFLILAAVFAGLAFNSYQPGRGFFLLPVFALFTHDEARVQFKKNLVLFLIPFIIVSGPVAIYLLQNPVSDIRINQQFFLKNTELTLQKKMEFLGENIRKTAFMFTLEGDVNGRHNYPKKPALNLIFGLFFGTGLFAALKNMRSFYNKLFVFYFLLSLAPTILTYPWENPNMLRTYTAIPSIIYFAGLAIDWFLDKFKNNLAVFIVIALLFGSVVYDLRTYFIYQVETFRNAFEIKDGLRNTLKLKR